MATATVEDLGLTYQRLEEYHTLAKRGVDQVIVGEGVAGMLPSGAGVRATDGERRNLNEVVKLPEVPGGRRRSRRRGVAERASEARAKAADDRRGGRWGKIVEERSGDDGHNCLRACEKAGVAPRFEVWSGNPFALAWSLNGERRDLNEVVKYLCRRQCEAGALAIEAARAEVAERANEARALTKAEAEGAGATRQGASARMKCATHDGTTPQAPRNRSADVGAALLGIGRAAVEKGGRIEAHGVRGVRSASAR